MGGSPPADTVRAAISRWSDPVVGIAGVVLMVAVVVFFARGWVPRERERPVPRDVGVLAILPFDRAGADASTSSDAGTAFVDALVADLTRELSSDVTVVPAARAAAFRGSRRTLRDIAAELGADSLLVGTVRATGDEHSLRVRLVRAQDSHELWSARVSGDTSASIAARLRDDIFGVELEATDG